MKRTRRFWLIGTVVVALALALLGRPRGDEERDRTGTLDIETVSPRGDVARLNSIDVVFSSGMVPLGGRSRWKGDPPLRLDPPVRGSFSWIGTRVLTFIPADDLPPGTEIRAVVPAGTRSLDRRATDADFAWTIVVGRPRLERSSPDRGSRIAATSPLHLLFTSPPGAQAADSIFVEDGERRVRVRAVAPDSIAVRAFLAEGADPRRLAAYAPVEPLRGGEDHVLVIPARIPFEGSAVGLAERIEIPFATYGAPQPLSARGDWGGIEIAFAGPVDAGDLLRSLVVHPDVPALDAHPTQSGDVRVSGRFSPGKTYTLRVRRGLTSLLGDRLAADAMLEVEIPHRWEELRIVPGNGFVPPAPGLALRIEGANVDTVTIRGGWVHPDSVPRNLTFVRDYPQRKRLPLIGKWIQPKETPDSVRVIQIPFEKLGTKPAGAQAVHVRVSARALYPNPGGQREYLSDEALLQVTELGLSSFGGRDPGAAWVTSLVTGKPVPGARVSLHGAAGGEPAWKGTTDAEGLVFIPPLPSASPEEQRPIYAQVRKGEDRAWLEVPRPYAGVYAEETGAPRLRAYTFFDRPMFRPGEGMHWQVHVRSISRDGIGAAGIPSVDWLLRGPDGREIDRGAVALAEPGMASSTATIPADALPGLYTYKFSVPDPAKPTAERRAIGWGSYEVRAYRLPRFEAHLDPPADVAVSGNEVQIHGRFGYFGGGALSRAPVRWTLSRQPYWERPEGTWDYQFSDERPWSRARTTEPWWGQRRVASGEGTLDEDGRIRLPVLPDLAGIENDQVYVLEMGARDLTDRSAYDRVEFPVFRAALRVGARARTLTDGGRERFELATLAFDTTGTPVAGVPLRMTVEKRIWQTVRVRYVGGAFGYENAPQDSLVQTFSLTSAGADPATVTFSAPSPGSYTFVVEGTDAAGRVTRARSYFEASGQAAASWYRDDGGWLELTADRKDYAPFDTARVLIPCPDVTTEGLMLVMDEGMKSIVRLRSMQGSPRLPVPLTSMPPGEHVLVTLVGPRVVPDGMEPWERLPYHGWGRLWIPIRPDPWRLNVQVAPDAPVHRPGEEVTLSLVLRDATGQPVGGEAAIAVVDDAIFALAGEPTVDPLGFFFEPREGGLEYADVRFHLARPITGEKGEATPGGDGAMAGVDLRRKFLTTAYWNPRVVIGPEGRASVTFRLPDDLTRFRIRALATKGTDRFGYAESKIETRKPLLVEGSVPRLLRDGDAIEAVALVRSHLDAKTKATVRIEADGARIDGKKKRDVKVDAHGQARAVFRLSSVAPGGARLRFSVEGALEHDAVEVTVPADHPLLHDIDHIVSRADPLARTDIEIAGALAAESSALTITASPSLLGGCADAYAYVADYPYACAEQRASSLLGIVAQAAAEKHLKTRLAPGEKESSERLGRIVTTLQECANDWELRSWPDPGSPRATNYVTGYALHAATRARGAGIPFPRGLWDRLGDETARRLEQAVNSYANENGEDGEGDARGHTPQGGERGPADEPPGMRGAARDLGDVAWLLWTLSEADRLRSPDSLRVRADMVDALYARRAEMDSESRMILALAMGNVAERPGNAAMRRSWPNMAANVLSEVRKASVQRTAGAIRMRASDSGWGDGLAGDERATAFLLTMVARLEPSSPDIQGMILWLLRERSGRTGAWSNQHASALVLEMLTSVVVQLEGPTSDVTGRLSIGGKFHDLRFATGGDPIARIAVPLADLASPDGNPRASAIRVEADGRRPIYFTATVDQASPALAAGAREEGMILARTYVDRSGTPVAGALPLGEPLYAHLVVVTSRDARAIVVEDHLPAGVEPLELRFQNAPRLSMRERGAATAGEGGGDGGAWDVGERADGTIVHTEMHDRLVRVFVEDVRSGVHHWYYPVLPTTAGRFRTPGARAEMLYSPEIYAVSAAEEIRIERKDDD